MGKEDIKFIFLFIIFQGGERVRERGWGGGKKIGRRESR